MSTQSSDPRPWAIYLYMCADYVDPEPNAETRDFLEHKRANLKQILEARPAEGVPCVVQFDEPGGATRYQLGTRAMAPEYIGAVNTGEGRSLEQFLGWAYEQCPAEHVAVVITGMGIFERTATVEKARWNHMFSICDDSSNRDSMDLSDLSCALRSFVEGRCGGRPIDLLAFDMCEIQFLEVAYELEELVDVLLAPQTTVPPTGWNYARLVETWTATMANARTADARTLSRALARELVEIASRSYKPAKFALSALDLRQLSQVTEAFDAFTIALTQHLGDELVWRMRGDVLERVKKSWGKDASAVAATSSRSQSRS